MAHFRESTRKTLAPVLGALALSVGAAVPAFAATELLGGGYIVAYSDRCAEYGWSGVHQVLARYEPQGAPGNLSDVTQMSLLFGTGTVAFRFDNIGGFRRSQRIDAATYIWNGPYSPENPTMSFHWDYYGDIPGPNDDELEQVIMRFSNFNEHEGCNMNAYLTLKRN